jgi:hypothetical protein
MTTKIIEWGAARRMRARPLGDRVITEAADSNVWHSLGFEPPLCAATGPTPIIGKNLRRSGSREGTFSSGQLSPHGLGPKEQANREKTKVATMGLERCERRPQKGAATD